MSDIACQMFNPLVGRFFGEVRTFVQQVGPGNYLEFPTVEFRDDVTTRFSLVDYECNRGVFGYLSWGFQLPIKATGVNSWWWTNPQYINFAFQVHQPPKGEFWTGLRLWARKGCLIYLDWDDIIQEAVIQPPKLFGPGHVPINF